MTISLQPVISVASMCCSPVTSGIMSAGDADTLAAIFKAIGDPTRLRLLSMIAAQEGGQACVCDLNESLDLSQATVSHHLKKLLDAGLVTRTRQGTWSYYALVPGSLDALSAALASTSSTTPR